MSSNETPKAASALRNSIIGVALMAAGASGGVAGLKFYTGQRTPDDVYGRQDTIMSAQTAILSRLEEIEDKLTPETFRPNPWTSLQAAQQQELTRQEFTRVAQSLGDISRALGDLRKIFLDHQVDHQNEERRGPID